jgi:tRNA uridine 5-carbamoylmethylation protein Kti12
MKKIGALVVLLSLIIVSCEEKEKKKYLPETIGAINSLAVVMDNELWEGKVGDQVRQHFAAPVLGLSWEEPLFTINQMPPKVFSGTIIQTRSVLFVAKDTLSLAHIKTDVYATPQKVGVIKGRTDEEIISNLEAKADEIVKAFKEVEIQESQKRFLKSLSKETVLNDMLGITLSLPSIYKVGKQENNFIWIDRQIQKGSMNIIAYDIPNDYFKNDSTFVKEIVAMRDSIGKQYIPGPDVPGKITYMMTEKAFAPYVFPVEVADRKAVEVRGIWEINGYPMAGPFLTYIINDDKNNRKVVIEGFVFAPATEKRDDMFQLEAILKTVKFSDKK